MPTHTDEETAIVTEVSRPPVLGVGHEVMEILLEGIVVESLEGRGIVKVGAVGVARRVVLAEDVELDSVGPPGEAAVSNCLWQSEAIGGAGRDERKNR